MKADPSHQRILLDLQDADNHLVAKRRARLSISERDALQALEADLSGTGPAFITANGVVEDTRAEIARIEDDVRLVESRLTQDVQRRDQSSSAKDIAGFEHEIATLNNRKEQLEEAELVVMQRLEDAEKELAAILESRSALNSQIASLRDEITDIEARLESEENEISARRFAIAESVPADLLALYEKQRERYGVGAALLTRGVSGGSGVALTATDLDAVRHAALDDVVLCPDSNCILIRTEESGL